MTDDGNDRLDLSESRVREIVREEVRAAGANRRQVLAALGVGGLAGLAGCASGEPADGANAGLTVEDDVSTVTESARTLDFGRNLDVTADGDRVRVDGREIESAAADGSTAAPRAVDGAYVGRPGDLQSALDDAAADGVGLVRLDAGATYELGDAVEVPSDVVLDCTGALLEVTADVDVFQLHRRSQVRYPRVRTTGVDGYASSVFHVYPRQFEEHFGAEPLPVWSVYGGWSEMTPDEGTCIELHGERVVDGEYDSTEDNWNVYFCHFFHNCVGGRRYAYLHREGGDTTDGGHVNGNIVKGFATGATRFVETDDSAGAANNMVNGNKFYLATQPGEGTEWLWYANKGRFNELYEWGNNWDYYSYGDASGSGHGDVWYIGPNAGANFLWRKPHRASGGLGSMVVDDSDGASGSRYLTLERTGVPVDELAGAAVE